ANVDVVNEKLEFKGGHMRVPEGPGLGVTLNRDKLAELAETRVKFGRDRRDDMTEMRKFFPDWEPKRPRW
ncbi:MAG: glucarate dehydratase, partial [Candidatus Poribacteria bacterium]|nr:glucarate dehydratase [Candidatus Poribacteria bacterium]